MALLLRALRDVRILSGDFDLLPPLNEGTSLGVSHLLRNFCELDDTSSRSSLVGSAHDTYLNQISGGATPPYDVV